MPNHKIVIRIAGQPEREMDLDGGATVGRAFDNSICIDDSRVSRYHAVIEEHKDGFYLNDLGSINGTSVNGEPVASARRLEDGDVVSVGGAGIVEYFIGERRPLEEGNATGSAVTPAAAGQARGPSSPPIGLTLAVAGITLGVIAGVVLLVTSLSGTGGDGSVRIVSPQSGATIRGPETIRVDARKNSDVKRIIYLLNGVEIASAEFPPYDVTLDPAKAQARLGTLSGSSILTITVEDEDGNRIPPPDTVVLAFDFAATGSDPGRDERASGGGGGAPAETRPVSGSVDTSALSRNLATQVSGKSLYVFDGEFAEQIRQRTGDYRIDVIDEAARHRRQISNAFGSQGVSVPLGFVMAIAQSRFREGGAESPDERIGFWRVPRRVAVEQGYVSPNDSASTLSDPQRSAEIAAQYMKDLLNLFGPDSFMFAIACYGMPIRQAAEVQGKLEAADPDGTVRRDFWSLVRSGVVPREGADRVVRFFAAGIVAENPREFGLSARPISTLYP